MAIDHFFVSISRDDGTSEDDSLWESVSGGGVALKECKAPRSSRKQKPELDRLTLRGPLTPGRKAMCDWITETVRGEPWKRTVVIKEILKDGTDGKTFTYFDCFPTRYVFPSLSASGTGNLYEEFTIKPDRVEVA